ncbi:MAG: ABC transporter substrate-binding protein [Oscillospiraceae bacterium]|nr:ABC transporter substrate-binding protein [Oscillospiraceae bacterium]
MKRFMAVLLAIIMVLTLSACTSTKDPAEEGNGTGTGGDGTNAPTTDEQGNEVTTAAETKSAEDLRKEKVVNDFNASQGEVGNRTVLNFNTFTDETAGMLAFFLKENPEFGEDYYIKVELNTEVHQHRLAVSTNIGKTGSDSVDLFIADVDYAMEFAGMSGTASLADLGIEITESEYYAYTLDLVRIDGTVKGLSHQATPGAMYYRADIAEEILGIKSDADMQKLVSDWDKFLETMEKIMEESDDLNIIYGADELKRNFMNSRDEAWVVDNEFNIDMDTLEEFVRVTQAIKDMGGLAINGGGQWANNWYSGMKDGVFSYFGSTWYLHYTIKPNAKEDGEGKDELGNGSYGLWGMVPGPATFYWGGTYWFGSKVAAEDDAKKDAVAQIIEFFCVNDDSMFAYMDSTGDFPSKKAVAKKLADNYDGNDFFLFKTNHFEVFAEVAEKIDITKTITPYDATINSEVDEFINAIFSSEAKSFDDAIQAFKAAVRGKIPTLDIL